jgi:glycosyltransferase involved in cell wall biosynthesis
MNVYLAQLYEHLSRSISIDIFVHGRHEPILLNRNLQVIAIPDHNHDAFARRILDHHACSQYDLVHTHYWLSGLIGQILHARTIIPWVHTFHTIEHLKGRIAEQHRVEAEYEIIKTCDFMISQTHRERSEILKIDRDARVLVIPHGVNTRGFTASKNGHKRLLFVGRVTWIKGIDILIDALRYVEYDTELTIAGGPAQDKDTFDSIRTYARGLPVSFLGTVSHEALHDLYRSSSIVIIPSFYESFGLVALEAMSSARPVIGFQDTGLIETVGDTAGILVSRNERALAQAIVHILRNDRIGMTLGAQGRIRALQYDWQYVADAYRKTYEAIGKK